MTELTNRLVAALFAIAFNVCLVAPLRGQPSQPKQLQVIVIAISQFNDDAWQNPRLELSIKQSSRDIQDFFGENFPKARITVLQSPEQTTAKAIRNFFSIDGEFRKLSNNTVTVLFIISHGVPYLGPTPPLTRDLRIVGSATHPKDPRENWVSIANDVMHPIHELDAGSIVFVFLDTCYSGSFESFATRIQDDLAQEYGIQSMVMASALAQERSYRATFSEALIDRWKESSANGICTSDWQAPNSLRRYMMRRLEPPKLDVFEANPQVIIPFLGDFCLESFDKQHGLLVLFNASSQPVSAVIDDDKMDPMTIQGLRVVPHMLKRDNYNLKVFRPNDPAPLVDEPLDLKAEPVLFEVLGTTSAASLGDGYLETARYVKRTGLSKEQETAFEKRAASSFGAAGKWRLVETTLKKVKRDEPNNNAVVQAELLADPNLDFAYEDRPSQKLEMEWRLENELSSVSLASIEKLAGRFDQAANFYFQSVWTAKLPSESAAMGKEAYFAYGASHHAKKAREVRLLRKLQFDDCPSCLAKENTAVKEEGQFLVKVARFFGPSEFSLSRGDDFASLCRLHSLATISPKIVRQEPGPVTLTVVAAPPASAPRTLIVGPFDDPLPDKQHCEALKHDRYSITLCLWSQSELDGASFMAQLSAFLKGINDNVASAAMERHARIGFWISPSGSVDPTSIHVEPPIEDAGISEIVKRAVVALDFPLLRHDAKLRSVIAQIVFENIP